MAEDATWTLTPAPEGTCSQCARTHEPHEAHDQQSLRYQYVFYIEHGRWPSWADAMAHCTDEAKAIWRQVLEEQGVDVDRSSGER